MQEFFMDYGLWLLIGLLVIIGLVFLLSGKGKAQDVAPTAPATETRATVIDALPVQPAAPLPPIETAIVEPLAVEPLGVVPAAALVMPTADTGDDLLRLKGVGPKLNSLLADLGIIRFDQIAAWTDSDIAAIDAKLGNFKGRPVRDQWVDQARYLAAGDIAGFEAKYGKL